MPDSSDRRARAIQAAYKLEHDLYGLENTTLAEIRADLEATRRAVFVLLATATKDWQIHQAKTMLAEIDRQIKAWTVFTANAIGSRLPTVADIGAEQVVAALKTGGRLATIEWDALPKLSRDFIAVAYQSLPMLITNIGDEMTARIGRILRQAVLAQRTPLEAMQEIGTIAGKGPFRSAFERGETILRTEYGRIAQTANYSTLSGFAAEQSTLRKEWSAVMDGRVRPTHARADGQVREVDKPFDVGGHPAMYPHDPRLPASESVSCRCISVAQDAAWGPLSEAVEVELPGRLVESCEQDPLPESAERRALRDRIASEVERAVDAAITNGQRVK